MKAQLFFRLLTTMMLIIYSQNICSKITEITSVKALTQYLSDDSRPSILMFYAPWCSACKAMKPIFQSNAQSYINKAHFLMIDSTKNEFKNIITTLKISGVPTIIYKEVGYKSLEEFTNRLQSFLGTNDNTSNKTIAPTNKK